MALVLLYLSWMVLSFTTSSCGVFILSADAGHSRYADHISTFVSLQLEEKIGPVSLRI